MTVPSPQSASSQFASSQTGTPVAMVAFDMAGTTIDEHGDVYRALRQCVEETGVPVADDDLQTWMGADKTEAIRALLTLGHRAEPGAGEGPAVQEHAEQGSGRQPEESQVQASFDRFRELLREFYRTNPPVALPGVEEALATLSDSGLVVALTTGFSTDVAELVLDSLDWKTGAGGLLDAVVCADEVAAGRPYPHMIHRAMERTATADVRSVLVAGDTVLDMAAGHASGAGHVVGVLTGRLTREDFAATPATAVLGSVAEVPALVGRLRQ